MRDDDVLRNILNNKKDRSDKIVQDVVVGNDGENTVLMPILDEIDHIKNSSIKHFVRSILLKSHNFFTPIEEGIDSMSVIHIKRAFRIAKLLLIAQERNEEDTDIVLAAVLLQDVTKLIEVDEEGSLSIDPFHAYTVEPFVQYVRGQDDILSVGSGSSSLHIDPDIMAKILRLIRCHLGIWSPVIETIPITSLEWMIHYADYLAMSLEYVISGGAIDEE